MNVTARELSRDTALLLDEVEKEDREFVVIRFGRRAALLGPVGDKPGRSEVVQIELPELQHRVMGILSDGQPHSEFSGKLDESPSKVALAVAKLEIAGLITRGWTGTYSLTREGRGYLKARGALG